MILSKFERDATVEMIEIECRSACDQRIFECVHYIVQCVETGVPLSFSPSSTDLASFDSDTFLSAAGIIGNRDLDLTLNFLLYPELRDDQYFRALSFHRSPPAASFIAEHFSEYKDRLKVFHSSLIHQILQDSGLVLDREDELLSFCEEYFKDRKDPSIFQYIHFARVSVEALAPFLRNISSDVLSSAWPSLRERLQIPLNELCLQFESSKSHAQKKRVIKFESLIKLSNDHSLVLKPTASSVHSSSYEPVNALNDSDSLFFSESDEKVDQWWRVDFDRQITIESYTIEPRKDGYHLPLNWIIEISENGKDFRGVDEQVSFCTRENSSRQYELKSPVECKSFRITLQGLTSSKSKYLGFRKVDFSGFLKY
jgi:hypothetical protein